MLLEEEQDNLDALKNPGYFLNGLKPEKVKLENIYFSVEACIEKTISYAKENNNIAIYNLTNYDFAKLNNITENNSIEKLGLNNIEKFKIQEMYSITGLNYTSYYVKGITLDNKNAYFNLNWDVENSAFDFKILTESEYTNYIETTIENASSKENFIESNRNNSIPYKYLAEGELAEKYFWDYIDNAINFPDLAYNNLDKDYREKKFGNVSNYIKYVQENIKLQELYNAKNTKVEDFSNYMEYLTTHKNVGLENYRIDKTDEYTQYVCIDSYGNYYIFRATELMKYTLLLDTYTIDIPEFTNKYNESNTQEKIILNLNKFMLALNDGDYKYAYNLLADSFKENNFKTQEEFENYIKSNLFEENEFNYQKYGNEAGTYYTYEVKITDKSGKSNDEITKTFIILLEEGTDFELSFNL